MSDSDIQKKLHNELKWVYKANAFVARELEDALMSLFTEEKNRQESMHINIYKWLLGYTDFPARKDNEGAYYWRRSLRKMIPKGILHKIEPKEKK